MLLIENQFFFHTVFKTRIKRYSRFFLFYCWVKNDNTLTLGEILGAATPPPFNILCRNGMEVLQRFNANYVQYYTLSDRRSPISEIGGCIDFRLGFYKCK